MEENVKFKVSADVEEAKKDLASVKDVDVTPEFDDTKITAGVNAALGSIRTLITKPFKLSIGADITDVEDGIDYVLHAMEFLEQDPVQIKYEMSDKMPQELFYIIQQLEERVLAMNEALGDNKVRVRWEGEKVAVGEFKAEIIELQDQLEIARQLLDMKGGFTPPDIQETISDLKQVGNEAQEAGRKGAEAGRNMGNGFLGASFSLRRLMFGMLGVQSAYSILSRASRQYMNENEAMKQSMAGVTYAIGDLMAPAIRFLINMLQHLVRWTMIAIAYISTFINVIFGTNIPINLTIEATGKAADGYGKMGKSAMKAAKQVKKAQKGMIAGIDELNVISSKDDMPDPTAGMGGAMGGGGIGGMAAPDMSMYDITDYLEPMRKFAEWLEKHRELIEFITVLVLGLVAAWAGMKLIKDVVGGVKTFFDLALSNPWVFVFGAIIAVIYLLWKNLDEVTAFMKKAWDGTMSFFSSLMDNFALFFKTVWNVLLDVFRNIGRALVDIWTFAWDIIGAVFSAAWSVIKSMWEAGKNFFKIVVMAMQAVWEFVWNFIKAYFTGIWNFIKGAWDIGKAVFVAVANAISTAWTVAWNAIKSIFSNTWNWIKEKALALGGIFAGVWEGAKNSFSSAFNGIKNIFSNVWNWILNQFKKGGAIFGGFVGSVADVFKRIVNHMIRGINRVISAPFNSVNRMLNRFSSISILGAKPFGFIGHNPVPVPSIPQFKRGYVGKQAQLGIFGEYTGSQHNPEIVTPEKLMTQVVDESNQKYAGQSDGGDLIIEIHQDGTTVTKVIKDYNQYKRNGGKLSFNV